MCCDSDSSNIYYGTANGYLAEVDLATGETKQTFRGITDSIYSCYHDDNTGLLYVGDHSGTLRSFDIKVKIELTVILSYW